MAVDPQTGKELWQAEISNREYVRTISVQAGLIFTQSRILREESGRFVRSWPSGFKPQTIASVEGQVFVGTWNGLLRAFDAVTGKTLWQTDAFNGKAIVGLAPVRGKLFVLAYDGQPFIATEGLLGMLKSTTGQVSARRNIRASAGVTLVANALSSYGSWVYLVAPSNLSARMELVAMKGDIQSRVWEYAAESGIQGPALRSRDLVYVTTDRDEVIALDAHTGKKVWRFYSN